MATYGQFKSFGPYFSGGNLCTLRCYHYIAGTVSDLDVYTDRGKTTTAAQPALSDQNGIVSFYADGLYKFRLDVATDGVTYSTLYTYDNVAVVDQSATLSGEGAALASASTLTLGTDGDFFHITGSTGPIAALSGTQNEVTLVFDATPTLTHSGTLILQYAVDYVGAAGVTMTFRNEGAGVWRELSRTPAFVDLVAAGDLPIGTGNNTTGILTVGAAGTVPMSRAAATNKLAYVAAFGQAIYGLIQSNGTDATNDLNISAGGCMDATGAYWMTLGTAIGKQSDAAWAVGGTTSVPLGGLDTGAVGNSDYYVWLIARSDTGVVDALYSLSSTAPTMPANYDFKRLIGWCIRRGGAMIAFTAYETEGGGLEVLWTTPTLDVNLANTLTTTRRTDGVSSPRNVSTVAILNVQLTDAAAGAYFAWIGCPDQADAAPSQTVAPLANISGHSTGGIYASMPMRIRTNAAGLIAARANVATVDLYAVVTLGFTWARRN